MKWLIACLLALCLVAPAIAGEDPYIAVVGNDFDANPFYFSPKHLQFLLDEGDLMLPTTPAEFWDGRGGEFHPEICDATGFGGGNKNARSVAGNPGFFHWLIRLPKKPSGEINICIQCGVLKPNAEFLWPDAIELCAAETGERVWGGGFCSRQSVGPGVDPIVPGALPTLVAIAFPGPFNSFRPFYLTAYKNPGTYKLPFWSLNDQIRSGGDSQILDGSSYSRILLKACMDKCVVVKIPTSGQLNAGTTTFLPSFPDLSCTSTGAPRPPATVCLPGGQVASREESDLVEGDLIYVRMIVPSANTVDIFCHKESAKLMGIGESPGIVDP